MKGLHNLQKTPRSTHRKKRLGRGRGSGTGTYAGRGLKGQRSRSGGKRGLTARSMKPYLLRIPKKRGDGSGKSGPAIVNLGQLQQYFNDGDSVTLHSLRSKNLIGNQAKKLKVLSQGAITKKLIVSANSYSKRARELIEKAGGTINEVKVTTTSKQRGRSNDTNKK